MCIVTAVCSDTTAFFPSRRIHPTDFLLALSDGNTDSPYGGTHGLTANPLLQHEHPDKDSAAERRARFRDGLKNEADRDLQETHL